MLEDLEITRVDDDADIVSNDALRSRIEGWVTQLNRIDRQTCLYRDYLPRDDERREWVVRLHQRLGKTVLACANLVAVTNQMERTSTKQKEEGQ